MVIKIEPTSKPITTDESQSYVTPPHVVARTKLINAPTKRANPNRSKLAKISFAGVFTDCLA
jgi:hypothetical protein